MTKTLKTLAIMAPLAFSSVVEAAIEHPHVPGEIIVKLRDGAENIFAMENSGVAVDRTISLSNKELFVVKNLMESEDLESVIKRLNENPEVEYAEPNFIYSIVKPTENFNVESFIEQMKISNPAPMSAPNDPMFSSLWGLHNVGNQAVEGADINALKAWEITKGSRDITIAVIDTGIDYNHEDLRRNIWVNEAEMYGTEGVDDDGNGFVDDIHGYDFANNDGDPMDGNSHGTHCAGTIGAVHNNGVGVAGVMDEVTLVPIKFLTDSGSGSLENALKSIDYATSLNVDIMSNSWGGGGFSQALFDSIKRAEEAGIVFVAAAGNSSTNNDTRPHYPSNYEVDNVIAVASHTKNDSLSNFSCYGETTVDIVAPGSDIVSTTPRGQYRSLSGTSMATPHVSGIIGLLLAEEGRIDFGALKERVFATSVPVSSYRRKMVANGRIDAYNLLTDTRPERNEPKPGMWEVITLPEVVETEHNYGDEAVMSWNFSFEGAKFIRIVFDRFDTEAGYDHLYLRDAKGALVDKISGKKGSGYVSTFVEGDTIGLTFRSDGSVNDWGFKATKVEVQY